MERVCRLLRETDNSLDEIAARTGYAQADYLSVAFKKHMGVSPREFRKDTGRQSLAAQYRMELK